MPRPIGNYWQAGTAGGTPFIPGLNTREGLILDYAEELAATKQSTSAKGQVNGYAGLDGAGKVPKAQLPAIAAADVAADVATQAELDAVAAAKANATHTHVIADTTGLQAALDGKLDDSQLGAVNGVASLDASGKVPSAQLPPGSGGGAVVSLATVPPTVLSDLQPGEVRFLVDNVTTPTVVLGEYVRTT